MNFSFQKIKKVVFKNWHVFVLVFLVSVFFVSVSYFNYSTQVFQSPNGQGEDFVKWLSPDETANYIFSKYYGQVGELKIFESYNLRAKDIMHPRSFRSDFGYLKPMSFLGIILIYGKIASVFSYRIIPYLTPLFASIGLIYYYLFVNKMFGRRNAIMSVFVLASFPVLVYYSTRSMFHNVLFSVFLTIGMYYGLLMAEKFKKCKFFSLKISNINWLGIFYSALSGLFFGLAAITRTSELIWLVPVLFVIWILNIRKINILKLAIFFAFFLVATLPMFYYNTILYSSPILGGYAEMNQSIIKIADAGSKVITTEVQQKIKSGGEFLSILEKSIFHFGFHPRQSLKMLNEYFVKMFYWIFWPSVAGFALLFIRIKRNKMKHWTYMIAWTVLSAMLVIYYGSWEFHDNPDHNSYTIGNSYTRYWLPIYMGAIPLAVIFLMKVTRFLAIALRLRNNYSSLSGENSFFKKFFNFRLRKDFFMHTVRVTVLLVVFFISIRFVLVGSEEGLVHTYQKNKNAQSEWSQIIELTESNSVVLTRYHDKLLFPERKVIVGEFDDLNMVRIYSSLAEMLPVYYYNFTLPEKSIKYLNERRLAEVGMGIEKVDRISGDFTLYRLLKK